MDYFFTEEQLSSLAGWTFEHFNENEFVLKQPLTSKRLIFSEYDEEDLKKYHSYFDNKLKECNFIIYHFLKQEKGFSLTKCYIENSYNELSCCSSLTKNRAIVELFMQLGIQTDFIKRMYSILEEIEKFDQVIIRYGFSKKAKTTLCDVADYLTGTYEFLPLGFYNSKVQSLSVKMNKEEEVYINNKLVGNGFKDIPTIVQNAIKEYRIKLLFV